MAAAPSILDTPQLAVSTDLDDVAWLRACELRGRLTFSLESQGKRDALRSPLCEWINSEIEAHLLHVGASAGTTPVGADAATQLCDQVYRARLLGYTGLAVYVGSLNGFATNNLLNVNDSHALLDFHKAADELEVEVRLAADDTGLLIVPRPVPLKQLAPSLFAARDTSPETESGSVFATPSRVVPAGSGTSPKVREPVATTAGRTMRAAMQDLLNDEFSNLDDLETPIPQPSSSRSSLHASPAQSNEPLDLRALEATTETSENATKTITPPPPSGILSVPSSDSPASKSFVIPTTGIITPTPQPTPVFEAGSLVQAQKLIDELQTTDGLCGWEEIEQRFTDSYLPLQQLLPALSEPTKAEQALNNWATAFADSYRTAFEALRNNRGKRPRLVLDVPSHAFQLSRKLEIEQCKLVLVDAMRADLAPIVLDKLRLQMTHTAECVAQGLLWSALPSTTAAQMELIARGTDSLRHFTGELAEEQLLSRGNDLRRLRPVRVGSHRMYKLDIVQYLTRDTTVHERAKLEQYAAEIATSVGRFLRQQGPNTMVYVFGDHGFGGACDASPENVLVPYFAWRLLG